VPAVGQAFDASGKMTNERSRKLLHGLGARVAQTVGKLA